MSDIVDRLRHPWAIDLDDKRVEYVPAKMGNEAAAEIERLRGIAKNAAILLEWLSAERSAYARDDCESVEVIRHKIVDARRTLSLSIQDANKHGAGIPLAEWENWHG